jgi:carbamoyltransferase
MRHHEAHAAAAFYRLAFEGAAIAHARRASASMVDRDLRPRHGEPRLASPGDRFPAFARALYSAFTYYSASRSTPASNKLMGLAPYGKPTLSDLIHERLIDVKDDGSF